MATRTLEFTPIGHAHENRKFKASEEMGSALDAAFARYMQAHQPDDPVPVIERLDGESDIEDRVVAAIARLAGIEEDFARFEDAHQDRIRTFMEPPRARNELLHWTWRGIHDFMPGVGEFWWSRTNSWAPEPLKASWDKNAGAVVFEGNINNDGGTWNIPVRAVSWFGLDHDRMPTPGHYVSAPVGVFTGDIYGAIFGSTAAMFTFGAVGKESWAVCELTMTQTLRDAGGTVLNAATTVPAIELFSMHSKDAQWTSNTLPGMLHFPTLEIDVDTNTPLIVAELEVKLQLTLKDGATFRFGTLGGFSPAFHKANQWRLGHT
jgi:hypothetical protein